ncbi:MAG: hypothetical protein ABI581_03055, partial [Sediminibacterium sp.]
TPPYISAKNILAPFRRRVKWLHMKHQADLDWESCVYDYYDALHQFLKRLVSIFPYKIDFHELKEFAPVIADLHDNLFKESSNIIGGRVYDLAILADAMTEISALCSFELKPDGSIKVADDPKTLFPDLVDTHDRIVGFVDILGFSQMIRHFDQEKDIKSLTDLKEVVEEAIDEMQKQFKYGNHQLDFRLFSDCLCISLPFFDNDYDFTHAFGAIMLGLKTYQAKLLLKGYLVRGGIAVGPYYSDYNMIFSGALVDAYEFEKYCNTRKDKKSEYRPPRILISPAIISKLENTRISYAIYPFFENSILKDKDGEYFLNPVFSTTASKNVYESVLGRFEESDDPMLSALNDMNRSLISTLMPLLTPETEIIMLSALTTIMDEAVIGLTDKKDIEKYDWTKELLKEMGGQFVSGRFTVHKVNFKEVVHKWEE